MKNWPRRKKWLLGCLSVFLVILASAAAFFGPAVKDLWSVIGAFLEKPVERKYDGTSRDNLKALYTAMMLYHESEGQFPAASGWMDAIQNRIKAGDMSLDEAKKKLVNPNLGASGKFGYAMNRALSGKYKGDIKDPATPLLFESHDGAWNANGDPKKEKGRLGITLDGKVISLK